MQNQEPYPELIRQGIKPTDKVYRDYDEAVKSAAEDIKDRVDNDILLKILEEARADANS